MVGPPGPDVPPRRAPLIAAITTFLAEQDARTLDEIRRALDREIDRAGPAALDSLCERLGAAGNDWSYYPPDPLARRIHEVLADRLLTADSTLHGIEHARATGDGPVVIVANHLSYSDANLLEVLLRRAGAPHLSDRLAVIAGPKVYSSLKRRFSSLCFGSIKTPQTSAVSSGEAVMSSRDVSRAARLSIDIALERLRLGEALLVFPEGTRSRARCLQPLLAGATRYLDCPGVRVLPVGLTGSDALFPIGEETFRPVRIVAKVGPPLDARELRARARQSRRLMADCLGLAIADELPDDHHGAYGEGMPGLDEARQLLAELRHDFS
jgi:1-acyl-sn-glycerol-3-phosphate acyltransferase